VVVGFVDADCLCRAKLSIKAVELLFRVDWSGCSAVFVDGTAKTRRRRTGASIGATTPGS
jgi:hypothetical protein